MWSLNDRFYEASIKRAFCATGTVKVVSEGANTSPLHKFDNNNNFDNKGTGTY